MSTLSKVFVVLVLIASVVFAMTSVARLKTTENYRQKYLKEAEARKAAEERAKSSEERLKDAQANFEQQRNQLLAQINLKDAEITSLKAAKQQVEQELSNLKVTLEKAVSDLASVKDELKLAREANERLRREKDEAVKRSAEDTEARLDAEQRLKESQLKVKNLLQEVKNKDEQITYWMTKATEYDKIIKVFEKRFNVSRHVVTREAVPTGPVIKGIVTDVRREGDEIYLQLSVGATSDVKEGMKFIIYGKGGFKGDMLVTKVYPDYSFGRLVARGVQDPVKGDRATTRLPLGT